MDHILNRLSSHPDVVVNFCFLRRDARDDNRSRIACRFGDQIIDPIFCECLGDADRVIETDGL